MKLKSLILLLIFLLITGLSSLSRAQTLKSVQQTGVISRTDDGTSISVATNATTYVSGDPTYPDEVTGDINMSGYYGSLGMNVGAPVESVKYFHAKYNGVNCLAATLKSKPFFYIDLVNRTRTLATMTAVVIKFGRGILIFQIRDQNGAILAAAGTPEARSLGIALTSGSTTIRF